MSKMKIRMHYGIVMLAVLSNMVTSQLSEVTGEGNESPSSGTTESVLSSSPLSSSPGSINEHTTRAAESSSLSTSAQDSSTQRTLPSVHPEADSSGNEGSSAPSTSSPSLSASASSHSLTTTTTTTTTTPVSSIEPVHSTEEAATSPRDPSTSQDQSVTTQTSSVEVTTVASPHSETPTTEIQGETEPPTSEATDDLAISTVTVETTSEIDTSTMTTEGSSVTETESTTFESTTDPIPSTTIIATIIDGSSSGGSSGTTGVPTSSTSTEVPETTDDTSNLPSPEGSSKESCFGQAEVNTAMIVAIVVSVNVITIAVTAFCVHRLVSRRLSWDPPPMNFNKQRAAVSLPRPAPRTGINLASDTECRSGEAPSATQIPIVITNEDGWCVPYSEKEHQKKAVSASNGTEDTGV